MDRPLRIGCVVLAAGSARRFGANKLLAPLRGKPLILHTLDALPPVSLTRWLW